MYCVILQEKYINISTIKKLRQIVKYYDNIMRKKRTTHDHLLYIINKEILAKLEYINQFNILTEQRENILAPLKKLFKHHLNLPSSTITTSFIIDYFQALQASFVINLCAL